MMMFAAGWQFHLIHFSNLSEICLECHSSVGVLNMAGLWLVRVLIITVYTEAAIAVVDSTLGRSHGSMH